LAPLLILLRYYFNDIVQLAIKRCAYLYQHITRHCCSVFLHLCECCRADSSLRSELIKVEDIIGAVENRRTAAWYTLTEDYLESLYYIAKMQEFYLSHIDGFHIVEPVKVWKLYTTDAYEMDSHYRHFHFCFGNTLKRPNALLEDALKKCSDVVEGLYREWFLKRLTLNKSKRLEFIGFCVESFMDITIRNNHM
jgi:hypothetical protein